MPFALNRLLNAAMRAFNKTLVVKKAPLTEQVCTFYTACNTFAGSKYLNRQTIRMKKYLSEKNALTVVVSLFCFVMMIVAVANKESLWEALAFALAFSFSVEILCHRAKENK